MSDAEKRAQPTEATGFIDPGFASRLALIAFFAAIALIALAFSMPICPTKTLLGIPCPSCGMTRAVSALVQGDLKHSFIAHPLMLPGALLVGIYLVRGERWQKWLNISLWIFGAILIALWLLRLTNVFPHPDGIHVDQGLLVRWLTKRE